MSEPLLQVENLKTYFALAGRELRPVDDVSFSVGAARAPSVASVSDVLAHASKPNAPKAAMRKPRSWDWVLKLLGFIEFLRRQ